MAKKARFTGKPNIVKVRGKMVSPGDIVEDDVEWCLARSDFEEVKSTSKPKPKGVSEE